MRTLRIYFKNILTKFTPSGESQVMSVDVATGKVSKETDPEILARLERIRKGHPKLSGVSFSPGGAVFPEEVVEKWDQDNNSLIFKPGWKFTCDDERIILNLELSEGKRVESWINPDIVERIEFGAEINK